LNLALYWKRKYRNQGAKEPWYILTNLPTLNQALAVYRCRWGIEQLVKDCKTARYHLEETKVNQPRFLALVLLIAMAYSLATIQGQWMRKLGIDSCDGRIQEHQDKTLRQSDFSLGLYGQRWIYGMELWNDLVLRLIALKLHKRLYFQRGFYALSLMQQVS
jgi:hypothetical protein